MDIELLSSSLLRELTYTVYNQGYHADHPARSEWPKFTKALVDGGSVRALNINNAPDGSQYYGVQIIDDGAFSADKLMRLDITAGTRLFALEEFTFRDYHWGGSNYLWDHEHCLVLRNAMDWSRLRKLDFGSDRPDAFFTVFTGLLPDLTTFRFGVGQGPIDTVKAFLESITALEVLDIDRAEHAFDMLWPAIMAHKNTLRELILRPTTAGYCEPQYLKLDHFQMIVDSFPALERLGWDAPCQKNVS
jgi:hypothetical protein